MGIYDDETGIFVSDSKLPFVTGILPPKLEQNYMNPVRFLINYRIVPGFGILCGLLLAIIVILMSIDDVKYGTVAIILFGLIGLLCVVLLMTVPKTREWEIAAELKRYDFSPTATVSGDTWELQDEGTSLCFSKDGLTIDNQFFWYNHLQPCLVTTNRFNRIWIALQFGSDPMHSVYVPLTSELIAAVNHFEIPLKHPEALNFLLENKEKVFREIYSTGTFSVPETY